jgi:drug/metabolite transporter (DMT)-like permease
MDVTIFLAVLAAAFMHASWNMLVKTNLDKFSAVFLLQAVLGLAGLAMLIGFGLPPAAAWLYALASAVVHTFYLVFLAKAYEAGDFSLAYPIARGSAPLFTLVGSLLFAGDVITFGELAGILIVIGGLLCLSAARNSMAATHGRTIVFALLTALMISFYTLIDGLGARVAGDATQYAGLAFFAFGLSITATAVALRGPGIIRQVAPYWRSGIGGGLVSALAYWIIIWCMTKAPIAMVAALRETSVFFGLAMSSYILKERLTGMRILGGILIVAGAMVLRLI